MELFQGQNLLEFAERFKTDLDCKEYLSEMKWKDACGLPSKFVTFFSKPLF
jgi:hypothetical protein